MISCRHIVGQNIKKSTIGRKSNPSFTHNDIITRFRANYSQEGLKKSYNITMLKARYNLFSPVCV